MRYLPHTEEEIAAMLDLVGVKRLDDLFSSIPDNCRKKILNLPDAMTEWELNLHMDSLAESMAGPPDYKVFLGAGRYDHFIPASVTHLLNRSEFVTAYTPYQPEMSQGTLQAIYEFQTLAARLMGVDLATASHYDGATALAEALLMAVRKTKKNKIAVSGLIHPAWLDVVNTYFAPGDCEIIRLPWTKEGRTDLSVIEKREDLAAVAIQSPNFFGCIEDLKAAVKKIDAIKALFIVSFTEALAYGLLKSPGNCGADIVCGEGQSLGLPQAFGGPGLGMLGSRSEFMRLLPGRLVGRTKDIDGMPGFVLTLATREQHIRREKATSNICSNNSLCALTAVIYMASLGGTGIRQLAQLNHDNAQYLKTELKKAGFNISYSSPVFNEFVVEFQPDFKKIYDRLLEKKIIAGLNIEPYFPELPGRYLLCVTETITKKDMDALIKEVQS